MIRIVTLVENTSRDQHLRSKHGLSLYVETPHHKLLFDLGPNSFFAENAEKLGVDVAAVDTVVISHGHRDHGGGLGHFLALNTKAKIYVQNSAFEPYYTRVLGMPHPIGLDVAHRNHPQVVRLDGNLQLDEELAICTGATGRELFPSQNASLLARVKGEMVPDDFRHEQYLTVRDGQHYVLFSGCSHNGVLNILKCHEECYGTLPTHLIGGFHQYNPTSGKTESEERVQQLAQRLATTDLLYYTCHCTGPKAYHQMQEKMDHQLAYLSVGDEIFI